MSDITQPTGFPVPTVPPTTTPDPKIDPVAETKKKNEQFKSGIAACKSYRRKLIATWRSNIDFRRGKPFTSQTDEDRIAVNLDWSLTNTKQAALFSQVPKIRLDHPPQTLESGPWIQSLEQRINDTLVTAGIESAMDECLPDVINASGISGIIVAHESITEEKQVPSIDMMMLPPQDAAIIQQTGMMPDGSPIPMITVPNVIDHRYTVSRVSPADLLWPLYFTGSDFDKAPWIGHSGRITWAQAVQTFHLLPEDKEKVLGEDRSSIDKLTHDTEREKSTFDEMVGFDEIFYKETVFDVAARSYDAIHHLVFITGKDEAVIDEPWKGQLVGPDGKITGALKFPLRILTLTYITDETIPPSDTAVGRPQVNEMNKSRGQVILQRERSIPIRWFDVNRVDPTIQNSLMRGTWQAMIPVQGQGTNVLGEVARANMPVENFTFDKVIRNDLAEVWNIGGNQQGTGNDVETKGEANILESNFQTRIGRDRAKVGKFFCSIAEVLGGLMILSEPPDSFGPGFDPTFNQALSYTILADSTVLLDSNQRLKRLMDFVNFSGKSGWLNIEPALQEIATLSGLDPAKVIRAPESKPPVEPNISLRLTGIEDLMNPLTLAFLMKSGQAPDPQLIEQAKQLITMAVIPPQPLPPPPPGPPGPDGMPSAPSGGGELQMTPPTPILTPSPIPPGLHPPTPPPPGVGNANPNWSSLPKINKRTMEGGENK